MFHARGNRTLHRWIITAIWRRIPDTSPLRPCILALRLFLSTKFGWCPMWRWYMRCGCVNGWGGDGWSGDGWSGGAGMHWRILNPMLEIKIKVLFNFSNHRPELPGFKEFEIADFGFHNRWFSVYAVHSVLFIEAGITIAILASFLEIWLFWIEQVPGARKIVCT